MLWAVLADAVLLLHLLFIAFAVLGGLWAWTWRPAMFLHLPALAWAAWVEFSGRICPLTPLENRLRQLGGAAGYEGSFVEHYLLPLIYPAALTPRIQLVLGSALVAFNVAVYLLGFLRNRKRRV